jgi:hypothetical protein
LTENIQLIKFGPLEETLDGIMVTGFGELGDLSTNVVGSRRGRTNRHEIHSGDVLDFGVFYMLIKKKAN